MKVLLEIVLAMTATQAVNQAWARGLTPPPALKVSQWAEAHRVVTAPSPEPGPWRNARTPYLTEIMDCLSPSHPAREIDFMKGTQIGGTEAVVNAVGFYSHQAPTSGLIVLPSKDVAAEWSRIRVMGLFENTPCLQGLLSENRRASRANTLYQKRLSGGRGTWKIAWSTSGKVLRSTPAEIIIADEVDGFAPKVKGEGEPIGLLRKRFANFRRGKFVRISSPTDRTGSRIERGFKEGDQRYYFVPCPHCRHHQRLAWSRLRWPKGEVQQAEYVCSACDRGIREFHKPDMLAAGRWLATVWMPEVAEAGFPESDLESLQPVFNRMAESAHPSFHLSALYSPLGWYSWADAAADWERAQVDIELLKVFVMTVLGETWVDRGEAPDWQRLYERREDYEVGTIPAGGLFLTAGVDVQADRLAFEVVAWGRGRESWSVLQDEIAGDTSAKEVWSKLGEVLAKEWPHVKGGSMPILAMAVDSGFRPQPVYDFVRAHAQAAHSSMGSRVVAPRTVLAIKGGADQYRIISSVSSIDAARKRHGVRIIEVGTGCAKQELYDFLRLPARTAADEVYPGGFCHFPGYDRVFFQGLCSERKVVRTDGKSEWVKDASVRNEPLDCRVYARAAASLVGMDRFTERTWVGYEERVGNEPTPVKPKPEPAAAAPQAQQARRSEPAWVPERNWF